VLSPLLDPLGAMGLCYGMSIGGNPEAGKCGGEQPGWGDGSPALPVMVPRTPEQPKLSYLPNRSRPPASWLAALGALGAAVQTCFRRSVVNGGKTR
jgi:hypothetical protein